jgi:hypothetical protein
MRQDIRLAVRAAIWAFAQLIPQQILGLAAICGPAENGPEEWGNWRWPEVGAYQGVGRE